ncbi:nucleoid occlusion factor SlmA [Hydrogenophaga palleronii]|uniref:nucleoid occlusion factor SlmA n=1 Tax=Hydrogenophaga palleronii TaxID=65655 RepID=UPI0009FE1318|nr:nucleoid occlusion factor SlmA [Hydrogenophaga palleronii]
MTSTAPESPSPEDQAAREAAEAIGAAAAHTDAAGGSSGRKRPKPGERRVQILEALATMLEQPGAERITTAALAARLDVSEAALYRHFASKAQMFEGLIEFIEQSIFGLINQLGEREPDANTRSRKLVTLLLQFGEKNPGMTRVMVGDALVFENERLQQRMNLFFDKIEAALRQNLRETSVVAGAATPTVDAHADASAITAFCVGRLQRFARSGFKRVPSESLEHSLALLLPIVRH